jgi:hypothetical protein
MKKLYFLLLALVAFSACKKSKIDTDNGCISQVKKQHSALNHADSLTAVNLLQQNKIPFDNMVFEYFSSNTVTVNGSTNVYQHISAMQYFNGFPVLSPDFGYSFKDGIVTEITGTKYNTIDLDIHSTMPLPRLRQLYITEVGKNSGNAARFKDSCLVAEFGYFDLNFNGGKYTNTTPNFVKGWGVTPKNSAYPLAIFRDDNGQKVLYSEGIVTF